MRLCVNSTMIQTMKSQNFNRNIYCVCVCSNNTLGSSDDAAAAAAAMKITEQVGHMLEQIIKLKILAHMLWYYTK